MPKGWRVAQVRAVFRIPPSVESNFFGNVEPPAHLAYVDWFTPFTRHPDSNHGMYKVSPCYKQGLRLSSVVPVALIKRSVHLFPHFGPTVDRNWTSSNVLESCTVFYVNPFTDRHTYVTMY